MIISFEFENFRSFKDKTLISFEPSNIKGLEYSILEEQLANGKVKALSTSIIYGPNASGKSNILKALEFLKYTILAGRIQDMMSNLPLALIPFAFCDKKTIEFNIKFLHKNHIYQFVLHIAGVKSCELEQCPEVVFESLYIDDVIIYRRSNDNVDLFKNRFIKALSTDDSISEINKYTLPVKEELFLCNAFKTLISAEIYTDIITWFRIHLLVLRSDIEDILYKNGKFANLERNISYRIETVSRLAKVAGILANDVIFAIDKNEDKSVMLSQLNNKNIVSKFIESDGAIKVLTYVPLMIAAMKEGATLIIDELDTALHPAIVLGLVNAFHNNELNINKAQLIFTSHNPIYMKSRAFRRDEIRFVERDKETKESTFYTLSDFGTSGKNSVKNTTDIMSNYMSGKYGAIEYVDFTDIIHDAIYGKAKEDEQANK